MAENKTNFTVIELSMLNKNIFIPLSGLGTFTSQFLMYPLVLLRTRLQLQQGAQVYSGVIHATSSIIREEGFRGLYNGFFVRTAHLFSGIFYLSTYEAIRDAANVFPILSSTQRSFIAGAVASGIAQSFFVPVDVISQHLMVLSRSKACEFKTSELSSVTKHSSTSKPSISINQVRALTPIRLTSEEMNSNWLRLRGVIRHIEKSSGLKGFYKGYMISMCTFVPSSALWWGFYDKFCDLISTHLYQIQINQSSSLSYLPTFNRDPDPESVGQLPRLPIQLISAPLAGICSAIIVNPMDCVRVRMQVSMMPFRDTLIHLWSTEGLKWLSKGLSARLIQTTFYSFWLVLIYEPMKILCLKDEYRDRFYLTSTNN